MPRQRDGLRLQLHWRAGRDACGDVGGAFGLVSTATPRHGDCGARLQVSQDTESLIEVDSLTSSSSMFTIAVNPSTTQSDPNRR